MFKKEFQGLDLGYRVTPHSTTGLSPAELANALETLYSFGPTPSRYVSYIYWETRQVGNSY